MSSKSLAIHKLPLTAAIPTSQFYQAKSIKENQKEEEQAGAELSQAQLKLRLDLILIFCRFGFFRFGLLEW